jgi:hypothetical protein
MLFSASSLHTNVFRNFAHTVLSHLSSLLQKAVQRMKLTEKGEENMGRAVFMLRKIICVQ